MDKGRSEKRINREERRNLLRLGTWGDEWVKTL